MCGPPFVLQAHHTTVKWGATHSRPKRDYLYVSPAGCRLFQLPLGAVELALCASSTPEDLARMEAVYARHAAGDEPYPAAWLRAKGLGWAAEIFLEQLVGKEGEDAPPAAPAGWGELGGASEPPPPASCEAVLQAVLASAACQAHPEDGQRFLAPVAPYTGGQGK